MSEWKEYRIDEIATLIGGGTPDTNNPRYWDGNIPWICPSDLTGYTDVYISQGAKSITTAGLKNCSAKMLPEDTILVSSRAPVGYVAIAKNPVSTNQGFRSLVLNENIADSKYIYYTLKVYKDVLHAYASGATFPELSGSSFKKIRIPLPVLSTQKTIGDFLYSLDSLIENNNRRIALLEQMAEQIYKEWFVRMRFPGYENTEFEKGVPKGWENIYFRDFIKLNRGFDLPDDKIVEGIYPIVASTSIKAFHNQYKVEAPCIVTGRSGSLGTVQYVNKKAWPLNTSLYVKDFKGNSPQFVFYFLKSIKLENFNCGAGVPTLNQNHLHTLKLVCPSKEIQNKFDDLIVPIFNEVENLQLQTQTLKQTRDLLLPRLISGKLRVEDVEKELETDSKTL